MKNYFGNLNIKKIINKYSITVLIILLFTVKSTLTLGQEPQFSWAQNAGGSGFDWAKSIALDTEGNNYIKGEFQGTSSFGNETLTSNGVIDFYISKIDESGNFIWTIQGGGNSYDYCHDIVFDGNDHIYIIGEFFDTTTIGGNTFTSQGDADYNVKLMTLGWSGGRRV
ncbi:MAG: hypothetical protein B6D61_03475 [Bacteroidetes bacterium 4484_249]|nr:MAG: hypothetical protein B6D61_03475 [Bacteroidetes bacterium 4484_249]